MSHDFSHLPAEWQDCIEAFLVATESHSGSRDSRNLYRITLHRFLLDGRLPSEYSRADVVKFLNGKSTSRRNPGADVKPNTYCSRLQILNSFYKFCAEYEVAPGKPISVGAPTFGIKYKKVGAEYRFLPPAELDRVLAAIDTTTEKGARDKALILFYWWSGKRRAEVQRLVWADLEFTTVVDPDGSRRSAVVFAFRSKGRSRELQHAELPQPAWLALEKYLQISGRLSTMQPDSPLFTSSRQKKGEGPLCKDYINKVFHERCEAVGLPKSLSLHVLRHSGAKTRWKNGQDLVSLQKWLGHSSLATTQLYIQGLEGTSDSFAQTLSEKLSGQFSNLAAK